jgi:ribose/xylose/arabinose/galactoside ABC-type transport system permease subunit
LTARSPNRWNTLLRSHEFILCLVLMAEWLFFYWIGTYTNRRGVVVGFGTVDRQLDILRHSCEIGLLAVALTPVIITAGKDLSVGSLLGLCAILFGSFWHDLGCSIPVAAALALVCGGVGGALNATLITLLRLPPLIVTLGTFSLFRGLAEALTRGAVTYTDFPAGFLFLGQERWLGLPAQSWVFGLIAIAMGLLVHRMVHGRSFRAIGFSPEGARYAGLPVNRRLALVYVLAGLISAVAGIIYTARLGQAKSDAGTGYELFAITAVVLGGTSIFGGTGSIYGTLLGVAAIAVLRSGLATTPAVIRMNAAEELTGVLTGALLLVALTGSVIPQIISRYRTRHRASAPAAQPLS